MHHFLIGLAIVAGYAVVLVVIMCPFWASSMMDRRMKENEARRKNSLDELETSE